MTAMQPHQLHWEGASDRLEDRLIAAGVSLKANMSAVLRRIKRTAESDDVEDLEQMVGNGIPDRYLPTFWAIAGPELLLAAAAKDKIEMANALINRGVNVQMNLVYGDGRKPIADHPGLTLPIHEWARNGRLELVKKAVELGGNEQLHVTGTDWYFTPMQMAIACGKQDVALMIVEIDPRTVLDDVTNANTFDRLDRVSLEQHCKTYNCPEFMDKVASILAAKAARSALDEVLQDLDITPGRTP